MIKVLRTFFLAAIAVIVFSSCNDSPTAVPQKLIPESDKIEFKKFDSQELNVKQSSSNYEVLENLYGGSVRILGQNSYAKSSILFHWNVYLPDTTLAYINSGEVTVDTALVRMVPKFHMNYSMPISFTVQKLKGDWSLNGFTRDSLNLITNDGDPNILTSPVDETDSTVSFLLQNSMVDDWLKLKADTNLTNTNFGVILKPTAASQGFIGFQSTFFATDTNEVYLTIYLKKGSTRFDTVVVYPDKNFSIVESVGNVPPEISDKIVLLGGYALRGKLFMDVPNIPKDVSISKAILELTLDEANTVNGDPSSDSLFVHMYADSANTLLTGDSLVTTLLIKDGNKYTGNITWMVQKWINGTDNQGVQLTMYDELSTVAKLVFYGSTESNPALRPKLTIYYPKKL